jgi:hypothetical protein
MKTIQIHLATFVSPHQASHMSEERSTSTNIEEKQENYEDTNRAAILHLRHMTPHKTPTMTSQEQDDFRDRPNCEILRTKMCKTETLIDKLQQM